MIKSSNPKFIWFTSDASAFLILFSSANILLQHLFDAEMKSADAPVVFRGVRLWQIMCRTFLKGLCVYLNHVVCITQHLSLMQQRRLSAESQRVLAPLTVIYHKMWTYGNSWAQDILNNSIISEIRQAAGQKLQRCKDCTHWWFYCDVRSILINIWSDFSTL